MPQMVADDVVEIKQRADQLAKEREMVHDVDKAFGVWLELHGNAVGIRRQGDESDYSFRVRIKTAKAAQAAKSE